MLTRNGWWPAFLLAATWGNAEPAGEAARNEAEVPAPAAVYCTPSDDLAILSWARVSGAAGYQVWEWPGDGAAGEVKPEWIPRERLDPEQGRTEIHRTRPVLPRLAVSSLFLREGELVSSRPIPAVFSPAPGSRREEMPPPFPRWALLSPDRDEAEFAIYRERREDALIGLILQQGFRFTRRVFLAGKSMLKPDNPDSDQPASAEPPATDPEKSG
ncbi:MAG: hypothetical protein OXH50_20390 [Gemmatimonadetes bacterium]|nr:hypothetical protein [Gemmatimonadota bacterium]